MISLKPTRFGQRRLLGDFGSESIRNDSRPLYALDSIYFHSLKNHEAEDFVGPMFEMGRETLALPFEEKMKYWQGNKGDSFG